MSGCPSWVRRESGGCCSTALRYHTWTQVPFSSKDLSRSLPAPLLSDLVSLTQKVTRLTANYRIVLGHHARGTGMDASQAGGLFLALQRVQLVPIKWDSAHSRNQRGDCHLPAPRVTRVQLRSSRTQRGKLHLHASGEGVCAPWGYTERSNWSLFSCQIKTTQFLISCIFSASSKHHAEENWV